MSNVNQLRAALTDQLARLNAPNMTPEKLELEIKKSKAIAEIGSVLVETAKVENEFIKITKTEGTEFFNKDATELLPEVKSNIAIPIEAGKK